MSKKLKDNKNKKKEETSNFKVNNLISNLDKNAKTQDSSLINPWGISIDNKTIWISDNGSNVITNYDLKGNKISQDITVPPTNTNSNGNPSAMIVNKTKGFIISKNGNSASSYLIIATENGIIAGYNSLVDTNNFVTIIDNSSSGTVYKGLALSDSFLYAADFHNNKIDMFDYNFNQLILPPLAFTDLHPTYPIPPMFAPFNIIYFNDLIYVLYAKQNPPNNIDDLAGTGSGFVSVFDLNGNFIKRFISGGNLNSPWGFSLAPRDFGKFNNNFLIGNFGDGKINIYDQNGQFIGTLQDKKNNDIIIDGLWGLFPFGRYLFFSSGPNEESNGLIGNIRKN